MNPQPIKYILYARKSSESEEKQVASIPSQIEELKKLAKENNLHVVESLSEEMSAKDPGRPIFNQMIASIQKGNANGILCWKLDRLARNQIDGGFINHLVQKNVIQHIQTFQRGYFPTDNILMMSLEFGMANQFVLDLSVNTKRGMRNKVNTGDYPHKPPLGYLNNKHKLPDLKPIYKDPERFPIMKSLWEYLLKTQCSLESLYNKALKMGLTISNGTAPSKSNFCSLFRNPFYYGDFLWKNELYAGKHDPMISKAEFERSQEIFAGRASTKMQSHSFAYTGLVRCGECGASITAEEKTKHQKNGNIHHYTYYRCTKRIKKDCSQKPVRLENFEKQIMALLERINIPPSFHEWAIEQLKTELENENTNRAEITRAQRKAYDRCVSKLESLLDLHLTGDVSQEEYRKHKEKLIKEKTKYDELINDTSHRVEAWLKTAEDAFSFAETAVERFKTGSLDDKREILACLGSAIILKDRSLEITLQKPLHLFPEVAPEVQKLHNRLEPLQSEAPQRFWEAHYAQNKKWGG